MTQTNYKKSFKPNRQLCGNCSAPEGNESAPKLSACARCALVCYCSKECQRAHWKANHREHCIPKADRAPQHQQLHDISKGADSDAAVTGEKCAICQDTLADASLITLPCTHAFHGTCVAEMRKFGVQQVCPLCRIPLPPGPENVCEHATLRYMVISCLVEAGRASWSTLPDWAQREMDTAIAEWRAAAEQGLARAQYHLGVMLYYGRGVARSAEEAVRWFSKAADQGDTEAQLNLGVMFRLGCGLAQSDEEAVRWYSKAANQGDARAQSYLGGMFEEGRGVAQSDVEAVKWVSKAADQGNALAQCSLGLMFEQGRGVVKSDEEAVRYFRKTADQGNAGAQFRLAHVLPAGRNAADAEVE